MNQRLTLFLAALLLSVVAFAQDTLIVTDATLAGEQTYDWDSTTTYILDGLVYLEDGGVLNIGPGTVIKARANSEVSTGDNTSALIIARGAQIFARGTADAPIIFTPAEDDLTDPLDLTSLQKGLWGGVIILGNAPISFSAPENGIEGIASNETRARYGGTDSGDNSGVLNYVSIRHGGFALSSGDEINGLTLGGVGSGTEIDYIEVFANLDDGIEWFGGSVRVDHAVVSFCADDGMDYDQGWVGAGQYWFVLQGPNDPRGTGRAGEHDGAQPDGQTPFSEPTIYNATYVGIGNGQVTDDGDAADPLAFAILFRDNSGGHYYNSIITDFNSVAVGIEQRDDDTPDSYDRLVAGDLTFRNNLFFSFGAGDTPADIFVAVDPDEAIISAASAVVVDSFVAGNNQIINPEFINGDGSQERDDLGGNIDPRPSPFGVAAIDALMADAGFDTTAYYGAFEPGNGTQNPTWLAGWTALDQQMLVTNLVNGVGQVERNGFLLEAPVPNPAYQTTQLRFELPASAEVSVTVLDLLGRPLARRSRQYPAGQQTETINVQNLPNGTYLIVLDAEGSRLVQKMVVRH